MLQERILQTLEYLDNIDQRKLSRIANTTESTISRFLNGHDEMKFESVLRVVKHLYPDEQVAIMGDYIVTQKSRNARHGLEYCAVNRLWSEFDFLLDLLANSTNPCDREWASMYSLLKEKREVKYDPVDFLKKVEEFRPKEIELKALKSILKGVLYFELSDHNTILLHNNDTDMLIENIKSDYIRSSYSVRLGLIMSAVHFYSNNLEKSRQYSYSIIGQDFIDYAKTTAFNSLGLTYMLEDYERAKDYFTKAINYAITFNHSVYLKSARLNLSFLQSFYGIKSDFSESIDDHVTLANYIYHLIQKGEHSLAREHLDQIDYENLTELDKGFYFYYNGLLKNDSSTFYESVEAFLNAENYFYVQLPLLELQKLGENEEALTILSKRGKYYEKNVNDRGR
ncbi:AimR family lysis-lysogeny pheromone receptor [Bacillus horti]|uniref:XRE family transcriptional regulator n=1 Tax=Caldalkalibacillus horti TaxID=77523 RepID=A0ABT9VZ36_9BACI|nr:AimR family lysis-lysogeny pheromone receptor [Bacillus horti]MDQ0166144.1 hypothetical protein [Bacillus horti]